MSDPNPTINVSSPSQPQEGPQAPDDDRPKTPYAMVGILLGAIAIYSGIFQSLDRSDFPETFYNSNYWFLLSLILIGGGVLAALLRKERRGLDLAIVIALFIASVASLGMLIIFDRRTSPSDNLFTVALYSFTDHTSTENLGASFRDNLKRDLEARYKNEILVLERDREIKGENVEEKVAYARKWGMRRSGCHLAVWAELSTDKDGASYLIDLHFVGVRNFGPVVKTDEISDLQELYRSYVTREALGAAVTQERVGGAVGMISLLHGFASYQRADYKSALRSLSDLETATAQFFAGRAAFQMATESLAKTRQLFLDAEAHYVRAIKLDSDGTALGGSSYAALGENYDFMLTYSATDDRGREGAKALAAFTQAAEIFKERGEMSGHALMQIRKAATLLELSKLKAGHSAADHVDRARTLLDEALRTIDTQSNYYSEAQNLLGAIYSRRLQHEKAIEAHGNALKSIPVENQHYRAVTLVLLAYAQTIRAWLTNDRSLYETGMETFRQAADICKTSDFFQCHNAHLYAGKSALNWIDKLRAGSPDWTREIERAATEFRSSFDLVSKTEQPLLFAESRKLFALAVTERASTARGDERVRLLKEVLAALGDGIDALVAAELDAGELYLKRAECYDRLALDSDDVVGKAAYSSFAKQDRESARQFEVEVKN